MGTWSRRELLRAGLAAAAAAGLPALGEAARAGRMPMRELGATGERVSALGLGGFQVGVDSLTDGEAVHLVRAAIDGGVTFLDNAREYNQGRSEERMGMALAGRWRERVYLMTKNCGHERARGDCMRSIEQSLRALRTDRLDLMLFHEVVYDNDPAWIFERGGLAAAIEARRQGKLRHIGFSGHKHPDIHLEMLSRGFRWDAVMMPLGVMDAQFRSFEKRVLPELNRRRIGSIGMKCVGGFLGKMLHTTGLTAAECIRYAMSLPVSTVVVGMESMELLRKNLATAHGFRPMEVAERQELLARAAPYAGDGRFERYKTTLDFEAPPGQKAHEFQD